MTVKRSSPNGAKWRHRILWNRRPENPSDGGDIDEIVLRGVAILHVEQMDDRCWWVGATMDDGSAWMGNLYANSRGRMGFSEQENDGVEWDIDDTHQFPEVSR